MTTAIRSGHYLYQNQNSVVEKQKKTFSCLCDGAGHKGLGSLKIIFTISLGSILRAT